MKVSAIAILFLHAAFLFLSTIPASGPALSAEAPGSTLHVAGERVILTSQGGICVVDYRYPRLGGLKDRELQGRINTLLRDSFFPGGLDEKEKEITRMAGNREKSSWTEERTYSSEIINRTILSIHYRAVGCLKAAAHPTKLYSSLTLDLSDGRRITLKSLFRQGAPYRERLEACVKKEFREGAGSLEKWNEHDFFLTRDSLVLFSLDDGYQSQGIQVPVKYGVIADILSPAGPLKSFALPPGH